MAIAPRAATVAETASGVTIAGVLPTGIADGDLLVATFSCVDVPANFVGPGTGWTALFAPLALGSQRTMAAYYKVVDSAATEVAPSASWAVAGRGTAEVGAWSGVHQTTPLDAEPVTATAGAATTVVAGSVTTVSAGARLVGGCAIASASASTVTPPAGMTQLVVTAGSGVRQVLADEDRPTVGATGTRTWTSSTSLAMTAFSVALRPASDGPAPAPGLTIGWVGAPTPDGFTVSAKTADATDVRVKAATDVGLTVGVAWSTLAAPDSAGWRQHELTGLSPATQYWYAVEMTDGDGVTHLSDVAGPLKTLPTVGQPASFRAVASSCLLSGSAVTTAFDNMLAADPDLALLLGDFHYANSSSTDAATHRGNIETQIAGNVGLAEVLANVPTVYVKSDHDSGGGNGSLPGAYTAPNRVAHLQVVPHLPQVDPLALYHSFTVGRVKFIVTDDRYTRTTTEYLDSAQVAWLQAELATAEPVKVWLQSGPWHISDTPTDPASGGDKWCDYPAQHAELAAWIDANAVGRILTVHGDTHSLMADDGTNAPGGVAVISASPMFQNTMVRGGPYSHGTYPATTPGVGGGTASQYGILDFTDTGDEITIALSGRDTGNVERVAMTLVVPTEPPPMPLAGNIDALAARIATEFNAVRSEIPASIGGVIDCSSMTLVSQVNAATSGAPAGTRVMLGPHGSGAELGVDETLILRPNLHYEGPGGRSRLCRLKATAGFTAGQPLVAAAGYLTNGAAADSPVVLRGVDIDADGKVGSDGLVVYHFWSTFEDIQIHNVTGNGTLSATAAIRIANRGIDGTTVTTNSHSENVFREIRINAPAAGASNIVQESYSSGAAPGGNGGAANQDGHLVGAWFAGGTGTASGRGLDFARAAGWTFRDIHMYGIGDDAARLLACYATDISGLYIENYGTNDTAADNYDGLRAEFLRGRGSTFSNIKISSSQVDSPAAGRYSNFYLRAGSSQLNAMVTLASCTSNLNKVTASTSRKTQAWRFGESGDTARSLYVKMAACQTDPLDGWMSPTRFIHSTVVLDEPPSLITRTQTFSATPTIDPTIDGAAVNITATADITALGVSTTGAVDGQRLRVRVLASAATRAVTIASAVRTSTGVTRGPHSVPSGEVLQTEFEYSSLVAAWVLVEAKVSAV